MFEVFNRDITIRQLTGGQFINGRYVEGSESEITIRASIQPLKSVNENVMMILPEGRRMSRAYRVYTSTELNSLDSENPDKAVIDNEEYEILQDNIWQNNIINHYRYIFVKLLDED